MTSENHLLENLIKIYDQADNRSPEDPGITISQIYNYLSENYAGPLSTDPTIAVGDFMRKSNIPEEFIEDITSDGTFDKKDLLNLLGHAGQKMFKAQKAAFGADAMPDPTEETHHDHFTRVDKVLSDNGVNPSEDESQPLRQNLVRLQVGAERLGIIQEKFEKKFQEPGGKPILPGIKSGGF